jgi:hypothetical protein
LNLPILDRSFFIFIISYQKWHGTHLILSKELILHSPFLSSLSILLPCPLPACGAWLACRCMHGWMWRWWWLGHCASSNGREGLQPCVTKPLCATTGN